MGGTKSSRDCVYIGCSVSIERSMILSRVTEASYHSVRGKTRNHKRGCLGSVHSNGQTRALNPDQTITEIECIDRIGSTDRYIRPFKRPHAYLGMAKHPTSKDRICCDESNGHPFSAQVERISHQEAVADTHPLVRVNPFTRR